MSTALERVNNALFILGATSPIKKARPEIFNLTFDVLVTMLKLWSSQGISTGLTIPAVIGDEMEEPAQIDFAIDFNLAATVAPYLQKVLSPEASSKASTTMQSLRAQFTVQPITLYPNSLPLGSGNTGPSSRQSPIGRNFYSEPETIDSGAGSPIIT
jgi:hypothetical protein